jgi:hypothetical protein
MLATLSGQASLCALDNEHPFKLGQCPLDMKHQLAASRRGVDCFRQRLELAAARIETGDQLDQVQQRPTETIEPPCDQHIHCCMAAKALWRPTRLSTDPETP